MFPSSTTAIPITYYLICLLVSSCLGFILSPYIINILQTLQKDGHPIRNDGPKNHLLIKKNVPSMGGLIIIISSIISTILFSKLTQYDIWIILFVFVTFAILGGVDDWLKIKKKSSCGITAKTKLIFQSCIACIGIIFIGLTTKNFTHTHLLSSTLVNLGYLYLPFTITTIVGTSNAVNITDGLDGLATVPIIILFAFLGVIAYFTSNNTYVNNIIVFCSAVIGSSLSFLWVNTFPAKIFMGDLGSLSIGGSLGLISVMLQHELIFAIAAMLLVVETLSVIVQVIYYKVTKGKRAFLMAPLHHHFEEKGITESAIVIKSWIIAFISLIVALILFINLYL
ncbi:phospho-N-acetylmuramoyl-pentapeptide-transferase [Neoehrlichia mikurensis]|uniref:Phospho-N-acetylmuramoyl-pentapeptide-transferase n=1 Tax=Neoehrlichia mikurensis TaxID=89586 RepID=A0A9Q9F417_9RICK|nr:phospho-N-acetylmuramoyl-pentapeptide-transferase [Neoehrlichia mikurensis]QXK92277.1 phospho-N-acetylmuramoyl-pentapeptide-transferase [Neoehrlichia mikurensis]QXK92731.1 phospho-N-acetylmuramoyl-pentapeptide-transferase [Neoehrlichia mikurensis]QXK93972.1 phospho-N-acetylmuramoyl-pentapeptide-transferase [Neoehrlichia mikurensis]UTO55865.1 phospho-N-acetylmuramoyl-pentapeptide-transferase [Neoehrlichia mikurensis]UTO56781.1 phospho-N-acetylmuramoyl-pentapeptide-transferase [Neoehrlichia m